ncbi:MULTISPECIES: hypothetical protein [Afifella]|uniref:Uncharacterized protein n=1 Tax=Afifella marina DSM 2698 TaxID=1120955 RepID=A0A1G5N7F9_AFIMA|nr:MULTISPECIES: hypothetical protein [Afifella]MCF1503334.1 hypothetical protein [Afifella sp. H1R]MCT8267377.1 hypothetical protein [Afifella sp. JA880]SCZ32711.1 hypothetical protein SAMN03080610_01564 [Afifella marina DSM 2698]
MARYLLFGFVTLGLLLVLADHLLSPPLHQTGTSDVVACAPCGAPCPSTR